jgi:Flp pilus assembly protein CpaB
VNRRKTTPLIISIVAAVLGAILLMTYAKSNSKSAPKEPTVAVVRAKALIPKDTPLTALTALNSGLIEEVPIPVSAAVPGAVTLQGLKSIPPDQLALSDISVGETILPARFAARAQVEKEKLPEAQGKLQITVALASERVLNGFDLKPGDKVALIATLAANPFNNKSAAPTTTILGETPKQPEQATKIILTLIRLIAPAGIAPTTIPGSVPAADPSIVEGHWYAKLAVTPEEAQKVVYAAQVGGGTVWLALDPDSVPTEDSNPFWNPEPTDATNIFRPVVTAPLNPLAGTTTTVAAAAGAAPTTVTTAAAGKPTRPGQPVAAKPAPTTLGAPTTVK